MSSATCERLQAEIDRRVELQQKLRVALEERDHARRLIHDIAEGVTEWVIHDDTPRVHFCPYCEVAQGSKHYDDCLGEEIRALSEMWRQAAAEAEEEGAG